MKIYIFVLIFLVIPTLTVFVHCMATILALSMAQKCLLYSYEVMLKKTIPMPEVSNDYYRKL